MTTDFSEDDVLNDIIVGYRGLVKERYQFENLQSSYSLPDSFDEERVDRFRRFFLNNVYPDPAKRAELNEAFDSLDGYLKHPDQLFTALVDTGSIILKHGFHLPKLIGAGLKALKSFRLANRFEHNLIDAAQELRLPSPYQREEIGEMLKKLPASTMEELIDSNVSLFELIYDQKLMKRITDIVQQMLSKMRKHSRAYGPAQVKGMQIAEAIISEGNALFQQLNDIEKQQVLEMVIDIERDAWESLRSN